MGDKLNSFKAASVQAASVFLDREASVEKACGLIDEAANNGAKLIALPEVFIPCNPHWAWSLPMGQGLKFSAELYQNSVDIPGESTDRIGEAARRNDVYVVIGVNERDNKSLYNTLIYFDRQGNIMGKHRKFKPTGAEKLVWGEGDGSTHKVYETDVGRIGGLICGEHTMALPGYTLSAMGEQVHIASWVGFSVADISLSEICSRYHAIAYNTFVISSQSVVDESVCKRIGIDSLKQPGINGGAWSAIIEAGSGKVMAGPLPPYEEGIVYADIDLNTLATHYFLHENTGHYWPKQFRVYFDDRELKPLNKNPLTVWGEQDKKDVVGELATPKGLEKTEE